MAITDQITGAISPETGLDHFLARTNNLSDIESASTALGNLGVDGTGVQTALGNAINTNGGLVTASTSSIVSGSFLIGGGSGSAVTGIVPGSGISTFIATPSSANLKSAVTDETGTGALVFATDAILQNTAIFLLTLGAGQTSFAPLYYTSGTNLTTPAAGASEYDGDVKYFTPNASNRAVDLCEHFVVLTSTNTLTSQTGAQAIFDGGGGPASGAITLPTGTFFFECQFALTTMNTSSGSWGFALGGTATKTEGWVAHTSRPATSLATAENEGMMTFNSAANTAWGANSTDAQGVAHVSGVIRVTVAGTIIPQVSLGVANAAVVQANSFFRIRKIGSSSAAYVGNWS